MGSKQLTVTQWFADATPHLKRAILRELTEFLDKSVVAGDFYCNIRKDKLIEDLEFKQTELMLMDKQDDSGFNIKQNIAKAIFAVDRGDIIRESE